MEKKEFKKIRNNFRRMKKKWLADDYISADVAHLQIRIVYHNKMSYECVVLVYDDRFADPEQKFENEFLSYVRASSFSSWHVWEACNNILIAAREKTASLMK